MNRYSKITEKVKREIVLLKAYPCIWGKCSFCDYILDNSSDKEEIIKTNEEILRNITGEYKVLEVINSGSCFEIPKENLLLIKEIIKEKKIERLFLESHWCYKNRIKDMREFFEIPITFKIGVETFDYDFRNKVLNKNAKFIGIDELKKYFDSPCIMVGIEGQTKQMISRDIEILLNNFEHATINVFVNNSTKVKRDDKLVKWFIEEYKELLDKNDKIDVLYNNTDFGVGD